MASLTLDARARTETGRQVRGLRRAGSVPAVVYGHRVEPRHIATDARALAKMWQAAGRTHLISLSVDGGRPTQVLFRELQVDPRTARLLHADFFAVNLREKLAADVPVVCTGEAPAVTRRLGQLLQTLVTLRVECLPGDLPAQISVDVSGLTDVDAAITVGDLAVPAGVTVAADPGELVVKIAPLRVQEAEAAGTEEAAAGGEAAGAEVAEGEATPQSG